MSCRKKVVIFLILSMFAFSVFAVSAASETEAVVHEQHTGHDSNTETMTNEHGTADSHGGHANLGEILPLWSCIPFACMLLSIALMPLLLPNFWHHHFGKVSAFWAAMLGLPFLWAFKGAALYEILHIILADYVPFIILLWSLYTVSGGILLRGSLRGTPLVNTIILIIGTILASWMGTTGAAMLLIRPFLRANDYRKNKTFMVVFNLNIPDKTRLMQTSLLSFRGYPAFSISHI